MGRTFTAVVVGGGLSGLSAGFLLKEEAKKAGIPLRVSVLEGDARAGGKIGTLAENGFRFEIGPNGFLDNKPATLEMVQQLGIGNRLLASNDSARKRFIFTGGALRRLPESPVAFLRSDLLTWKGKIRIAREYFVPRKKLAPGEDETLADFVRRRLGPEALDKLIDPMASGIFAGNPENMSLSACFGKIVALEEKYGGLIRGMLALAKERKAEGGGQKTSAGPGGTLWSFTEGLEEIIRALHERLGVSVFTGSPAVAISRKQEGTRSFYEVIYEKNGARHSLPGDIVVLAVPAYTGAGLMDGLAPAVAAVMRTIPYAGMAVVHSGYEEKDLPAPLDGFGFLVPGSEKRRILGGLWASSIFAGRAPEGKVLITTMMGGARDPGVRECSEEELKAIARAELFHTMKISAYPCCVKILRWEKAIPQYTPGHLSRVETIERNFASGFPGMILTGNAYRGIGVNDCVAGGMRTAVAGVEYLKKIPQ